MWGDHNKKNHSDYLHFGHNQLKKKTKRFVYYQSDFCFSESLIFITLIETKNWVFRE